MPRMFHSPGGYVHDRDATALDVVKYETDELGNKITLLVSEERLKEVSANDTFWATPDYEYAEEFGEPIVAEVFECLAEDPYNGFLVRGFLNYE